MRFIKKIELAKDFFAPRYLAKNTKKFRRLSAENIYIEGSCYHVWSFTSQRIPIGVALIPPTEATHMLLFSLEKTEALTSVPFRLERFLDVNETTVDNLIPSQALYVTLADIDKQYRNM